jgi:hypothetical protein
MENQWIFPERIYAGEYNGRDKNAKRFLKACVFIQNTTIR